MADQPNTERLRRLEEEVNQRARNAFAGLREQIAERLRRLSDEALEALEGLGTEEPPPVVAAADLEPLTREADAAAGGRVASDLLAALAALDRARSQGDVLSALAREARRFAGRTSVLLTRDSSLELWSAEGWDDVASDLAFDYPAVDGWAPGSFGRSAVELSGEARGELARRLGAEPPASAVLVPLVLRDRLAAVLYADGIDQPFPFGASLQVLTWAASQALESLPFRQREATPTLAGLGAGEPAAEAPALWGGGGGAAASGEPASTGRAVGMAAAGIAAAGLAAAGVVTARRGHEEAEPAAAEPPEPPEAPEAGEPSEGAVAAGEDEVVEASAAGFDAFDEIVLEEAPGPAVAAPPVSLPDEAAELGDATANADLPATGEEGVEEPSATFADEAAAEPPSAGIAGFAADDEAAARAEVPAADEATELEETHPAAGSVPMATAAVEPGGGESAARPEAAPPPSAKPPSAGGAGAEVAPPPDLEGPGRAFEGRQAAPDEEESRHDEARRLARLLVSEIRLYNEEEVEVGRRKGDIYERLREDIDRSRQMYDERVDPQVRSGTDYFYQELVRNLAGGDAQVLGM